MNNNLLKGKKGIVFGALDVTSIAWKIAEQCHQEGAEVMLSNAPVALRLGKINELAEKIGAEIVPADATNQDDIDALFDRAGELFGKVDFILHSIGQSVNVRKKKEYTDLNYDWLHKGMDISAFSFHRILQSAYQKDMMNEWGSVVALTYIAAQRTFGRYSDMAEAKAMLESIARSFGYHFGRKKNVRINTVSQSPTPTTAGSGVDGFDAMLKFAELNSPLGNATADECAAFCVMLFSDYTRMITMQNLFHDGGFSSTGISDELLLNLKL